MKANREFERAFFYYPEVDRFDYETYPRISKDVILRFRNFGYLHYKKSCLLPFVRKVNGIDFVDLYFMNRNKVIHRFVFRDGFMLPERDEKEYLSLIYDDHYSTNCLKLHKMAAHRFPTWNLTFDGTILGQIYFSSYPSGPREILYKAGLSRIAWNLDKYPSIDIVGTTPEEIIGHGLSLKALRVLNNITDIIPDLSERYLNDFAETYNFFSDYIGKKLPNWDQWKYLVAVKNKTGIFGQKGFNRKIYNALDCLGCFELYEKYFELQDMYPELKTKWIPDSAGIDDVVTKLYLLIDNTNSIQDMYHMRWSEEHITFEYSNDKFKIIMPRTGWEVYREAARQHNCLMKYTVFHAKAETTILFLRKKDSLNKNFVTIELCNNRIKQVKASFNRRPDDEVFDFILDYIKVKSLSLENDPNWYNEYDEEGLDRDLLKYIDRDDNKVA